MSDKRKEVRQARDICKRRSSFDKEQCERAILLLADHRDVEGDPLWSMAQVANIVGVKPTEVYKLMTKEGHKGGRLNPESFDLILEEIELMDRKESNRALTAKILADGTSSYMLAKLLGQSVSSVKYRAAQYKLSLEGAR